VELIGCDPRDDKGVDPAHEDLARGAGQRHMSAIGHLTAFL
jgi:hypothetical protein